MVETVRPTKYQATLTLTLKHAQQCKLRLRAPFDPRPLSFFSFPFFSFHITPHHNTSALLYLEPHLLEASKHAPWTFCVLNVNGDVGLSNERTRKNDSRNKGSALLFR